MIETIGTNADREESTTHEYLSRPFHELGLWSDVRPERPNDLQVEDLHSGDRVVLFDDQRDEKIGGHDLILTDPIEIKNYGTGHLPLMVVWARRVLDHATDTIPFDAKHDIRMVDLSRWGIVPTVSGPYMSARYIERYESPDLAETS